MCIYCGTDKYREIYKNHFGPIPQDKDGKSFHIHHKDGNHSNNSVDNLEALSIYEHYNAHLANDDWHSCLLLSKQMGLSKEEKSTMARNSNLKRMADGRHHFLDPEFQKQMSLKRLEKIENGTSHMLGGDHQRRINANRVAAGTHNFLDKEGARQRALKRIASGIHPFIGGNKGKDNPRFIHTLYKFQNITTGEVITSTIYDFRQRFKGTSPGMLIRGILKSTGGWKLITN